MCHEPLTRGKGQNGNRDLFPSLRIVNRPCDRGGCRWFKRERPTVTPQPELYSLDKSGGPVVCIFVFRVGTVNKKVDCLKSVWILPESPLDRLEEGRGVGD